MIPLAHDVPGIARLARSWGPELAHNGSAVAAVRSLSEPSSAAFESLLGRVSETAGVLSLSVWLFAQLPQIIENYANESVSGVSVLFLSCWIAGDVTNLLGCILTRALPFQTCLASYYCFIDCILTLQFWYYTRVYPRQKVHHNLLQSPNMLRSSNLRHTSSPRHGHYNHEFPRSPIDITGQGSSPKEHTSLFKKLLSSSFIAGSFKSAHASPVPSNVPQDTSYKLSFSHYVMPFLVAISHLTPTDIGMMSAWLCSFLYLVSRSPQIIKNFRSRSTKGISVFLFLFAMLGNLFYTVSIVTDLYLLSLSEYDFQSDPKFKTVLRGQLPFIVGSAGTVLFDTVILLQCWYYRRNRASAGTSDGSLERVPAGAPPSSPLGFQKPDWYTNNHASYEEEGLFSDDDDDGQRAPGYRSNYPPSETTSLMASRQITYVVTTPPPPHYMSGSVSDSLHPRQPAGVISSVMASLSRSINFRDSSARSPVSSSSVMHSGRLDPTATPPLPTSLIPSIIGTYSSVSRKMSNDVKVPFSPKDFLGIDAYQDHDNLS